MDHKELHIIPDQLFELAKSGVAKPCSVPFSPRKVIARAVWNSVASLVGAALVMLPECPPHAALPALPATDEPAKEGSLFVMACLPQSARRSFAGVAVPKAV